MGKVREKEPERLEKGFVDDRYRRVMTWTNKGMTHGLKKHFHAMSTIFIRVMRWSI
jgi:hypothetical protein